MAGTKATDKLTLCMRHGGDARPAGKAAGYKKEVGKLTKRATGRGVYLELYGVQLEQIGDSRPGKEGGEGRRGGRVLTICTHKQAASAERKGK